jgi:hypothetical protein
MRIARATRRHLKRKGLTNIKLGEDMKRSSLFVRGFLAGAGFVIAGVAAMTWGARAARVAWRRSPTAPNYAYLR